MNLEDIILRRPMLLRCGASLAGESLSSDAVEDFMLARSDRIARRSITARTKYSDFVA